MPAIEKTFKNSNTPNSDLKLPKGKLIKIEFSEEMKEEIRRIMNGEPTKKIRDRYEKRGITDIKLMRYNPPGKQGRIDAVRKLVGGYCLYCGNYNTHLLKYKMGGITLVKRFCEEHIPKII